MQVPTVVPVTQNIIAPNRRFGSWTGTLTIASHQMHTGRVRIPQCPAMEVGAAETLTGPGTVPSAVPLRAMTRARLEKKLQRMEFELR